MVCCRRMAFSLLVCLLLGASVAWPQATPPAEPTAAPKAPESPLPSDPIAVRKAAMQAQLEALAQLGLAKEELEKARAPFEQMLQMFTALEEAIQRRDSYKTQLEGQPQRLRQLQAEHQRLETRPPSRFPTVTQELYDQYEAQLQAAQTDIQQLHVQTAAGEARLAAIAKELEKRGTERPQVEKNLLAARSKVSTTTEQPSSVSQVERLELQLQFLRTDVEALEAEREWLTKRGPLHDALLRVAQTRLKGLQQDLDTIKQALGTTLARKQATLSSTAAELERQLAHTTDPTASLRLTVHLETIAIRTATADYQQQFNQLSNDVLAQEKRNAQERQDVDRLASLVERYTSGEGVAQRLMIAFERLRRERVRYRDTKVKEIEAQLHTLNERLFTLDDRLYEFDRQVDKRLTAWSSALPADAPKPLAAEMAEVRKAFEDQKGALRDQQQVMVTLVHDQTKLLTLHRQHKRLLDDGYLFVLTKMFWLRDGERMSLAVLQDVADGAMANAKRLQAFVREEGTRVQTRLTAGVHLWVIALLLFLVLPWLAVKMSTRLRVVVKAFLAACASRQVAPGIREIGLVVIRSAVWPAYLALLGWSHRQFLPPSPEPFNAALFSGLYTLALVLWVALLGRDILRRDGWGQQFWGLRLELCRLLRNLVVTGCFAALVFLVPRHILLTAPGEPEIATGSFALARLMLLAFQSTILVLIVIAGWRSSSLMEAVLARSHQQEGLLWRIWPFIYLALVAGILAIITLDVLGYRYAAQFVWLRALESVSIFLLRRLLVVLLVLRVVYSFLEYIFSIGSRGPQRDPAVQETIDRYFKVAYTIANALLMVLALGIVLEVWGVSVSWLVTSPTGMAVLTRAMFITLIVGITVVINQVSKVVTDYLLRPKTSAHGVTLEVGRKLRTMTPLIQTLIKVGVVFAAVLMILEQLNIATGPIIAGVGIFGLAVGFASQSLIKDFINGLFILFEDSISVGDIANLRGIGGQVEKITLRAITLRSLDGTVHVIPNSEISVVANLTKVFSRYLLDVRVGLNEDVEKVRGILLAVDEEMRHDPAYRYDMLEPLEIMGLDRFEESALIIRGRLKTRTMQQWRIGREFNRRLQQAFLAHGIHMPVPHRMLAWIPPQDGGQTLLPADRENGETRQENRQERKQTVD
jgi:small-conductance mechanosensitive channel